MRKARTSEEGDSDEKSVDDDGGGDTEMDRQTDGWIGFLSQ